MTAEITLDADLIDDEARDVVRVTGTDAGSYLQGQITQEIRDLAVGEARWTLVLDPTGKIEALARIVRSGDEEFVLDTDAGFGAGLVARLSRFKIRVDADIVLDEAHRSEPDDTFERARIARGWPRMGREIEPGVTIPAATGVETVAVNFTKGCYPGQELVERMNSRSSGAPQALRILDVVAGTVIGDDVVDGDEVVGRITSVAPTGTVALGYVKRGHVIGRPPAHWAPS